MRVIYCYSSDPPKECAAAIDNFATEAEWVRTEGLYGYNEAIASRWTGESDLVVIEADKEIAADTLSSFDGCDHHFCSFSYNTFPPPMTKRITYGLGCSRYSAYAQQVISPDDFMGPDASWQPCRLCDSKGCWRFLDSRICREMTRHGTDVHVHGEVKHHHVYDDAWWRSYESERQWEFSKLSEMKIQPEFYIPRGNELCVLSVVTTMSFIRRQKWP